PDYLCLNYNLRECSTMDIEMGNRPSNEQRYHKGNHDHWHTPIADRSRPMRFGIGGPVGSGKTALVEKLARRLTDQYSIAVITNDIYTKEDAEILTRSEALPADRIIGVETGGCPHTAIREDASMNFEAIEELERRFEHLDIIFIESG